VVFLQWIISPPDAEKCDYGWFSQLAEKKMKKMKKILATGCELGDIYTGGIDENNCTTRHCLTDSLVIDGSGEHAP
jgi:hypothetical protein